MLVDTGLHPANLDDPFAAWGREAADVVLPILRPEDLLELKWDTRAHLVWIRLLLTRYYDPMYRYQLDNKRERILFRGDKEACLAFFAKRSPLQTPQESPTC